MLKRPDHVILQLTGFLTRLRLSSSVSDPEFNNLKNVSAKSEYFSMS